MDRATGFIESPTDKRDYQLGRIQAPVPIPETYLPDISSLPIYDQSKQPSCTAHGTVWAKVYLHFLKTGEILDLSRRFIYALSKRDDGIPDTDGTYYRQACKELKDYGSPNENLFIDDTNLDRTTYNNAGLIETTTFLNALPRSIGTYAQVTDTSFDGLKQAIYQNKAVMCGIQIGDSFWKDAQGNVTWQESALMPIRIPASFVGGHAICLMGYDKNYIYFVNSWSKQWGRSGVGYFGINYLPYVKEAWTFVDQDGFPKFNKNLNIGMSNDDVYRLQIRLKAEGYADYEPTGTFGPKTLASVVKYQKSNNITPTGLVGVRTRGELNK